MEDDRLELGFEQIEDQILIDLSTEEGRARAIADLMKSCAKMTEAMITSKMTPDYLPERLVGSFTVWGLMTVNLGRAADALADGEEIDDEQPLKEMLQQIQDERGADDD